MSDSITHSTNSKSTTSAISRAPISRIEVSVSGSTPFSVLPYSPISARTADKTFAMLQANYGANISREKWALLLEYFKSAQWTDRQLHVARLRILRKSKFGTLTIADWVEAGEFKFYSYQWYREQLAKNADAINLIAVYAIPIDDDLEQARRGEGYRARPVWGWRAELDGVLPRYEHVRADEPDTRMLTAGREVITPETAWQIDNAKKVLQLLCEVDVLRAENKRLESDYASSQRLTLELMDLVQYYRNCANYLQQRLDGVADVAEGEYECNGESSVDGNDAHTDT